MDELNDRDWNAILDSLIRDSANPALIRRVIRSILTRPDVPSLTADELEALEELDCLGAGMDYLRYSPDLRPIRYHNWR